MKYKELEIWKDAVKLIKLVYGLADELPKSEEFNLKSQLKRAVVSVALNIAEGKGRKTSKDFSHFLNVACASLDEVDAIVSICEELDFIGFQDEIHNKIATLSARINALRNKLRVKDDDNT